MEKTRQHWPEGVSVKHYFDAVRDRDVIAVSLHETIINEMEQAQARVVRLQGLLAKTRTLEGQMRRREMHVARRRKVRK